MALPVIIVDSATGSDSAASGAGPGDGTTSGSALTGTAASTDGAGTTVTLDGSPDLTNVATDGSHVIYLADSTAGKRNFGKITAKDNTAKTVTVSDAFNVSLSGKSWAIGGKRATLDDANTRKLWLNNSSTGDAPGWTIYVASNQTVTSSLSIKANGITFTGPTVSRSTITLTANSVLFDSSAANALVLVSHLILLCSHGTKTSATALSAGNDSGASIRVRHVEVGDASGNHFGYGYAKGSFAATEASFKNCGFISCAVLGCYSATEIRACSFVDCDIGVAFGNNAAGVVTDCIISGGTYGAKHDFSGIRSSLSLERCTIDGTSSHGVYDAGNNNLTVRNCIITNCGGYGVAGSTGYGEENTVEYSDIWNCTSGQANITLGDGIVNVDPDYVGSGDYTPQEATLEGTAYPTSIP